MTLNFGEPRSHVCHVCASRYRLNYPPFSGPRPFCCPACDAPLRISSVRNGQLNSYSLLLTLSDAPINSGSDTWYQKLTEHEILGWSRTCADVEGIIDALRAGCAELYTQSDDASSRDGAREAATRAAEDRLREQVASGLLAWRLDNLRERTAALLRAEVEHHRFVFTARHGEAPPASAPQPPDGSREAALAAAEEVVRTYAMLAKRDPYQPDLGVSLVELAELQRAARQPEAALASAEEAVRAYRALARRDPHEFEQGLAASLGTLGKLQHEAGHGEAALASRTEGVRLYEALATRDPEAFQPALAAAQSTLGTLQRTLGRAEEALVSQGEAVRTYEALAVRDSEAFERNLAGALNNLANAQSKTGQQEAALATVERAFDLYWRCFEARPQEFDPNILVALRQLLRRLQDAGRGPDERLLARIDGLRARGIDVPQDPKPGT